MTVGLPLLGWEDQVRGSHPLLQFLNQVTRKWYLPFLSQGQRGRFRKEFADLIPDPWDVVAASFQEARTLVETDQLDWRYH